MLAKVDALQNIWPFSRRREDGKRDRHQPPSELRIATSGSFSIRASIEPLRVEGAGGYAQGGRVRAALFVPSTMTTVQFHGDAVKKATAAARSSCVHVLQMFTPSEASQILDDTKRIGVAVGWSDRGVSLPTQDVLVQNLSRESQELVHKAIREQLLPFARRQYPHLNAAFDKQPYPRPGNLFIVRYSAVSGRPGGRGLKLHKDETALTFNLCLSPQDGFEGGGTYFPTSSGDVDGILLRPTPGYCLVHDGNIKHAGNDVISGDRYILVGFYNADGRDRAGEEAHFSKAALEAARTRLMSTPPPPIQTIYFTTAVPTGRSPGMLTTSTTHEGSSATPLMRPSSTSNAHLATGGGRGGSTSLSAGTERRLLSAVAIQGPPLGMESLSTAEAEPRARARDERPRCEDVTSIGSSAHAEGDGRADSMEDGRRMGDRPISSGAGANAGPHSIGTDAHEERRRTMTSSSGAGAGTRLEVGATPQTLTITSGHDGHADETRELETGAMHMGGIKAASGAQSHGCLSYPDATAAKPHRVPSGGSKPNRAEDKRRPMPMAGASSATAAASSVARPHSTVSCMPHWPLLQLLQGKPRPRP